MTVQENVDRANYLMREAQALLPWKHPVGQVQWVHVDQVVANDYNPNTVPHHEMRLLYTSINEDGFTQPIVCVWDPERKLNVIVDGFHRWTVMKKYADIFEKSQGYVPIVVIDKDLEGRIAATVRHNRARGKHSVQGMGNLVFQLLQEGVSDAEICNKIGLEAEELARLKHVTGYSKLFSHEKYSAPSLTTGQVKAKAAYKKEHPDELVPNNF